MLAKTWGWKKRWERQGKMAESSTTTGRKGRKGHVPALSSPPPSPQTSLFLVSRLYGACASRCGSCGRVAGLSSFRGHVAAPPRTTSGGKPRSLCVPPKPHGTPPRVGRFGAALCSDPGTHIWELFTSFPRHCRHPYLPFFLFFPLYLLPCHFFHSTRMSQACLLRIILPLFLQILFFPSLRTPSLRVSVLSSALSNSHRTAVRSSQSRSTKTRVRLQPMLADLFFYRCEDYFLLSRLPRTPFTFV